MFIFFSANLMLGSDAFAGLRSDGGFAVRALQRWIDVGQRRDLFALSACRHFNYRLLFFLLNRLVIRCMLVGTVDHSVTALSRLADLSNKSATASFTWQVIDTSAALETWCTFLKLSIRRAMRRPTPVARGTSGLSASSASNGRSSNKPSSPYSSSSSSDEVSSYALLLTSVSDSEHLALSTGYELLIVLHTA